MRLSGIFFNILLKILTLQELLHIAHLFLSEVQGGMMALVEHSVAPLYMHFRGYNHSNVLHGLHRHHATSAEIQTIKFCPEL